MVAHIEGGTQAEALNDVHTVRYVHNRLSRRRHLQGRPKRVGVLVKHCNYLFDNWCIRRWFDEDRQF